jgi:hypothetical protein
MKVQKNRKKLGKLTSEESKPPSVSAAFSLAPYPSLAGRPILLLYFGLHPQGFAVSSAFARSQPRGIIALTQSGLVSVPEPELSPHILLRMSVCPEVGGLSTPANASQRRPPFLSRSCHIFLALYNVWHPLCTTIANHQIMKDPEVNCICNFININEYYLND